MKLVVDANVLVAELLRKRGRELIQHSQLDLYLAEKAKDEAEYELRKRVIRIVDQNRMSETAGIELLGIALQIIETKLSLVSLTTYSYLEVEARQRIPRDPDDWHTVAVALHTSAAIWTQDNDFLGCGCPTWTTETLMLRLF